MPNFPNLFKGAGPGTHWHANDPRTSGFTSAATRPVTTNAVVGHIVHYSHPSPLISFTFSFAVARNYALSGTSEPATETSPGYVWEIDLGAVSEQPAAFDTISEIAKANHAHRHNGDLLLIEGVAAPGSNGTFLTTPVPLAGGRTTIPTVREELQALVFAVRDSEVLLDKVFAGCVVQRHDVY